MQILRLKASNRRLSSVTARDARNTLRSATGNRDQLNISFPSSPGVAFDKLVPFDFDFQDLSPSTSAQMSRAPEAKAALEGPTCFGI